MWASKTEVGHRTAFLCKHCCSERHSCTGKKKKGKKKQSLLRRQNQVINLSGWLWWLLWGWSCRQALKRASLCLLVRRTHWSVKTVQGAVVATQQTTGERNVVYSAYQQPQYSFVLGPGVGGRLPCHSSCSHRQPRAVETNTRFPSKWSTEFNFWFFRCLRKWLVPLIMANYPCSFQWRAALTDDHSIRLWSN